MTNRSVHRIDSFLKSNPEKTENDTRHRRSPVSNRYLSPDPLRYIDCTNRHKRPKLQKKIIEKCKN